MTRTAADLGEVGVIERLKRRLPTTSAVVVGIGDDAAVLRPTGGRELLFASDMLVEGVHFDPPRGTGRRRTPARAIGWKALACNVSDIAAMGGVPLAAVASLGCPPSTPVAWLDGLTRGLRACAARFKMAVVGGDTVRAPRVVLDVAILGTVPRGRAVLRSGAKVGDRLFVTGRLGGSLASPAGGGASGRHATFTPRLREAQWLVRHLPVHAMMDLSDGLASDAWQMARASRVTLRLDAAHIPVAVAARTLSHALMDGEDFELLFAVPPRAAGRVPARIGSVPVTEIGRVVRRGIGVELVKADGRITNIIPTGFKHF